LEKNYKKIGILGGTFDPPHIGHVHISNVALKKFGLDLLMWIITKQNPLKKKPFLKTKIRIKLSKNITKKERKIFINYLDKKGKPKNTFNILKYLKKKNSKAQLFFLIGADNFINFHKWEGWEKIPLYAKIIVFSRQGYSTKALRSIASKKLRKSDWIYVKHKNINISSSLIRKV